MTIADVHFAIGKTHDVCQDYGLADDSGETAYAIVCDGCSASKDTDIGARLLARAALHIDPLFPEWFLSRADTFRVALGLPLETLDATLLQVRATDLGDAVVTVWGDGVVVARRRDGTGYDHWVLSFNNNAPEYLSYRLDPDRFAAYKKAGCGVLSIDSSIPGSILGHPKGVHFYGVFHRDEYDVVLVMSDGAESFQRREGTRLVPVPLTDVLDQVLDFKVLTHAFLRRRLGRFLGRFCPDNGWQHYDDFTVGGLVLDAPPQAVTP